jgi:hypothetical protein
MMKYCFGCYTNKPNTLEYFHKSVQSKDGLSTRCKDCRNKYQRIRSKDNMNKLIKSGYKPYSHALANKYKKI